MMANLTIEFFGLPGVGKSSLMDAVTDRLMESGLPVERLIGGVGSDSRRAIRYGRKTAGVLSSMVNTPAASIGLMVSLIRSRQPSPGVALRRTITWMSTQAALRAGRGQTGIHMLDEGVLQCLWSIGLTGRVAPTLRHLETNRQVVLPEIVVAIKAPVEVVLERIDRRAGTHGRLDRISPEGRPALLARGVDLTDELLAWYSSRVQKTLVIEVDNAGDAHLPELAQSVARRLLETGSWDEAIVIGAHRFTDQP